MSADELVHLIRQAAGQSQHDYRPFVYGHIASYDPERHRVRCIVPSMSEEDGSPTLTPWMPMGTLATGTGATPVQAGAIIISSPASETGGEANTFVRVKGTGEVEIYGAKTLTVNVLGQIDLNCNNGDVNLTAKGNVVVKAAAVMLGTALTALQKLCTQAFHDWVVTHTHPNTLPPNTAAPVNSLTSTTTSE
jgi:hypothetical protein